MPPPNLDPLPSAPVEEKTETLSESSREGCVVSGIRETPVSQRNILFAPEGESNLFKQLPQILLPLSSASLLIAEPPGMPRSPPVLDPACVILAQRDEAAVSACCDLLPSQGVCELQLSLTDKGTEALPKCSSVQQPVPSDWSRGLLPQEEGLICPKQMKINLASATDGLQRPEIAKTGEKLTACLLSGQVWMNQPHCC